MTQATQFLLTKGSDSMNVESADLATYLAAGWTVKGIRYSEGAEIADADSQFLMDDGLDRIRVQVGDVQTYLNNGYQIKEVLYGSSQVQVAGKNVPLVFLDVPAFVSAEIGDVDDTTLVVNFSTELTADDYAAGVTVLVDDVENVVVSAARQADHKVVHYTLTDAVENGAVVTFSYDDDSGEMVSEEDGTPLDDISEAEVTNNVPAP